MVACLTILALSGLLGCADTPVEGPAPDVSATVAGTDSVALTYICGNMFRIRNSSFDARSVRWDIYNASPADTGSLRARGRDVDRTAVDFFVTARTKGTMRLFVGATLVATKANGNKVPCATPMDTSALPNTPTLPSNLDAEPSLRTSRGTLVARTVIAISFDPASASSTAVRALLRDLNAQIIRVLEPQFIDVRIPDPGTNTDSLDAIIVRLKSNFFVTRAAFVPIGSEISPAGGIYPSDGPGALRADYLSSSFSVWPAKAMRLNPAWWCETGAYVPSRIRMAIVEAGFTDTVPNDLLTSVNLVQPTADTGSGVDASLAEYRRSHGVAVASLIAATGDNGIGIAGVMWRSRLTVFSLNSQNDSAGSRRGLSYFETTVVPAIIADNPRVLSLSTDFSVGNRASVDERHRFERGFYLAVDRLLRALPRLLIVKSTDNFKHNSFYATYPDTLRRGLLSAVIAHKAEASFADRLVLVAATSISGNRASNFSNHFTGITDIYAPGDSVPILTPSGALGYSSGTSFSTPLVAAVAGQLLAMDSTLSAADVKTLLLDGARDSVENSHGENIAPNRVGNISDVVYEADAYGSLRLLSSRIGRPLCGAVVAASKSIPDPFNGSTPDSTTVVIRRYQSTTDEFLTTDASNDRMLWPGPSLVPLLSVAPGGRAVSVSSLMQQTANDEQQTNIFTLQGGSWVATQRLLGRNGVLFGERDTLLLEPLGVIFARASALGRRVRIDYPQRPDLFVLPSSVSVAPDGSRFAFATMEFTNTGAEQTLWVIDSGAVTRTTQLGVTDVGWQFGTSTAWNPDSRSVAVAQIRNQGNCSVDLSCFVGFESTLSKYAVASSTLSQTSRRIILMNSSTAVTALNSSDEGGISFFRVSGPYFGFGHVDCAIRRVGSSISAVSTEVFRLRAEPCGLRRR